MSSNEEVRASPPVVPPPMMDIGVFWDYENVRIPAGFKTATATTRILEALEVHGIIVERRLYYDSRKRTELKTDRVNLDSCGFSLVDCPTRGKKETLDKKLIVDMMEFAMKYRRHDEKPCCIALVTSDGDYSYALGVLKCWKLKTVVIFGKGTTTAGALLDNCTHALSWFDDILNIPSSSDSEGGAGSDDDEGVVVTTRDGDGDWPVEASSWTNETVKDDDAERQSALDAVSGHHLTLINCLCDLAIDRPQLGGWVADALVAKAYHWKRGCGAARRRRRPEPLRDSPGLGLSRPLRRDRPPRPPP
mmetsp:Transcript_84922/g.274513  ORF Transcript_84922/g.274513 Transcript_84922/m.274513 type:complete len:305 (-) Transcript_84922:552-1466(-)